MPDIQCIPKQCAFVADKARPHWFPWNAEHELWSLEKEANVPGVCHREQFIPPLQPTPFFFPVTRCFNLELVLLAWAEDRAMVLVVSRHGFSAQFDHHPTVKLTLPFFSPQWQSCRAGLDNFQDLYYSCFPWLEFCPRFPFPEEFHAETVFQFFQVLSASWTWKDKINAGLEFFFVISHLTFWIHS